MCAKRRRRCALSSGHVPLRRRRGRPATEVAAVAGLAVSVLLILVSSPPATADLIEYAWAPGLVYDSGQDLTWPKDASHQAEEMTWYEAVDWAEDLVIVSGAVTYDDWRLPATEDCQAAHDAGEWGYLYTEYGVDQNNQAPFTNLTTAYWTTPQFQKADPYAEPPYSEEVTVAYTFSFTPFGGGPPVQYWQKTDDPSFMGYTNYAWPVRDGAPTPEPATLAFVSLGGAALMLRRRRRR